MPSPRVPFAALLALALLATPSIARAAQPSCAISVTTLTTNAAGGLAWDAFTVSATVSSTCQIQSVVASGAGHSTPLSWTGLKWAGTMSIAGAPHGPFVLTVTATDVFGNTASRDVHLTHDTPPGIFITAPASLSVARPTLRVTATCQDDDRCDLAVYGEPQTGTGQQLLFFASKPAAIDQDISFAAFEGREILLVFNATDSAGQLTRVTRRVFVESNPRYIESVRVPGLVLDDSATRTLFVDENDRVNVLEKATGQITVLSPRARRGGRPQPI